MSRVTKTAQALSFAAAVTPTFNAAAATGTGNGNTFQNTGRTFMYVKNGDSNPTTLTIVSKGNNAEGVPIADKTYTIPATSERIIWFPAKTYYNVGGMIRADWSNVTSVTFALIEMPRNAQ